MHLERIFGMIMQTNYKMINLCSKKGFESTILDEETVEMSLKLL